MCLFLKNVAVWVSVFNRFTEYGLDDSNFLEFIKEFKKVLHSKKINNISFDELNEHRNTKDKGTLKEKIDILVSLMDEFLHNSNEKIFDVMDEYDPKQTIIDFIKENVKEDVIEDDVEFYKSLLEDWSVEVI